MAPAFAVLVGCAKKYEMLWILKQVIGNDINIARLVWSHLDPVLQPFQEFRAAIKRSTEPLGYGKVF